MVSGWLSSAMNIKQHAVSYYHRNNRIANERSVVKMRQDNFSLVLQLEEAVQKYLGGNNSL